MKDKWLAVARSLAALCACTILFSLVLAALYYFQWISQSVFHICNWLFGICAFLFAGILIGIGIKKKALLHALVIIVLFAFIGFVWMDGYTILNILEFISKLLAYALGCMLVTIRRKD
ncbi:MAG: DUF3792 family protein [Erysipelotrichaceae bacterium]|nr:DUF3792 family protein [Erysipelotrichaceae bacterium]